MESQHVKCCDNSRQVKQWITEEWLNINSLAPGIHDYDFKSDFLMHVINQVHQHFFWGYSQFNVKEHLWWWVNSGPDLCHHMVSLGHNELCSKYLNLKFHQLYTYLHTGINTLRPRQNRRHFADDIFKCIFFNENVWLLFQISLKFVPKGPINNIPASVQIMVWRRPGDKPLSEPMMAIFPTHICVTQPQWVKNAEKLFSFKLTPLWSTTAYNVTYVRCFPSENRAI